MARLFCLSTEDYKNDRGNSKCGKCNWETSEFYVLAKSDKEAVKLLNNGNAGLCGNCMSELLTGNYFISKKHKQM